MVADVEFGWWFTGFVEGEGCFTYKTGGNGQIIPRFSIALRADDVDLLIRCRDFFDAGPLYDQHPGVIKVREDKVYVGKPQCSWHVVAKDGLRKIRDHFDQFPPYGQKRHTFLIWREMVTEYLKSASRRNEKLMVAFAKAISESKVYEYGGGFVVPTEEWAQLGFKALED